MKGVIAINKKVRFNKDDDLEAIRARLKKLRKSAGYTQSKMGDILGVSAQTVSGYENGAIIPGPEVLLCYTEAFQVDSNYLLEGIEESAENESLALRKNEKELILAYRRIPDWKKDLIMSICLDRPYTGETEK
ncbi:MAG: helix-turn-helix transcriptional regulator [Solobacterium sp.]|nr:helix-turn-helix transcriptional regulator [Solobacterium sp.]